VTGFDVCFIFANWCAGAYCSGPDDQGRITKGDVLYADMGMDSPKATSLTSLDSGESSRSLVAAPVAREVGIVGTRGGQSKKGDR
jgi:hypothetical protein